MQNTGCERDAKIQQKVVKMLSIKYKIRKRGFWNKGLQGDNGLTKPASEASQSASMCNFICQVINWMNT